MAARRLVLVPLKFLKSGLKFLVRLGASPQL